MNIILFCLNEWISLFFESISTLLPPDVRGAFVGAVVGAVGAYLVSQKTLKKERIRKRWFEHRNFLVELEHLLNEMIDFISCNRYASKKIIDIENVDLRGIHIAWSKPNNFPTDLNNISPLLRIELKNKLFSYNMKIRRINNDISNINLAYNTMTNAKLSDNITRDQYLVSFREYKNNNSKLNNAYSLIEKRTEEILTYVRVALDKDKKLDNSSFRKLPKPLEISEQELKLKAIEIQEEINLIIENSRKELKDCGII